MMRIITNSLLDNYKPNAKSFLANIERSISPLDYEFRNGLFLSGCFKQQDLQEDICKLTLPLSCKSMYFPLHIKGFKCRLLKH